VKKEFPSLNEKLLWNMTEKPHLNKVEISILFKEYKMFNSENEA
jgi:hypothetical protein